MNTRINNRINNRLSAVVAVVLIAAGSAFANTAMAREDEGGFDRPQTAAMTKSRADVKAELYAAQASGEWRVDEGGYRAGPPKVGLRSRAEVREETRQALRSGETLSSFLTTYDVRLDGRPARAQRVAEVTARLR